LLRQWLPMHESSCITNLSGLLKIYFFNNLLVLRFANTLTYAIRRNAFTDNIGVEPH